MCRRSRQRFTDRLRHESDRCDGRDRRHDRAGCRLAVTASHARRSASGSSARRDGIVTRYARISIPNGVGCRHRVRPPAPLPGRRIDRGDTSPVRPRRVVARFGSAPRSPADRRPGESPSPGRFLMLGPRGAVLDTPGSTEVRHGHHLDHRGHRRDNRHLEAARPLVGHRLPPADPDLNHTATPSRPTHP